MLELEQFGPSVGGIIVFKPDTAATERWSVKARSLNSARAGLPDESGQTLRAQPNVMARERRQSRG